MRLVNPNYLFGGTNVRNREQINVHLFCQRCHLLLQYPTQLLCCGIRLCRWCSKTTLSNNQSFICQFCDTHLSERQVHPDRGAERELNALQLECYACSWNGTYQNYLDHLEKEHAVFECVDCHKCFVTINCVEEHRKELCEYRRVRCGLPGCDEMIKWSDRKMHDSLEKHQKLLINFNIQYAGPNNQQFCETDRNSGAIVQNIDSISYGGVEPVLASIQPGFQNSQMQIINYITSPQSHNYTIMNHNGAVIFPFTLPHNDISAAFSLISPVFKTTVFGYSFILRTFSTLDYEDDNQQYLSVSLSLLRGEYDAILTFPFPYNIFICLCDQSGQRKHIISKITPDSNSSSLIRPVSLMNTEMDVVKFSLLSNLIGINSIYLQDNTFFIRVYFDYLDAEEMPLLASLLNF